MTNVALFFLIKYIRTNQGMINMKVIYIIHHTERVRNVSQHEIFTYRHWKRSTQYQICERDLQNKPMTRKNFHVSRSLPPILYLIWLLGDYAFCHSDKHKMLTTVSFLCNCLMCTAINMWYHSDKM